MSEKSYLQKSWDKVSTPIYALTAASLFNYVDKWSNGELSKKSSNLAMEFALNAGEGAGKAAALSFNAMTIAILAFLEEIGIPKKFVLAKFNSVLNYMSDLLGPEWDMSAYKAEPVVNLPKFQ